MKVEVDAAPAANVSTTKRTVANTARRSADGRRRRKSTLQRRRARCSWLVGVPGLWRRERRAVRAGLRTLRQRTTRATCRAGHTAASASAAGATAAAPAARADHRRDLRQAEPAGDDRRRLHGRLPSRRGAGARRDEAEERTSHRE